MNHHMEKQDMFQKKLKVWNQLFLWFFLHKLDSFPSRSNTRDVKTDVQDIDKMTKIMTKSVVQKYVEPSDKSGDNMNKNESLLIFSILTNNTWNQENLRVNIFEKNIPKKLVHFNHT